MENLKLKTENSKLVMCDGAMEFRIPNSEFRTHSSLSPSLPLPPPSLVEVHCELEVAMRKILLLVLMVLVWAPHVGAQFAAPGGTIPTAAGSIHGENGTLWRSDVSILNLSSSRRPILHSPCEIGRSRNRSARPRASTPATAAILWPARVRCSPRSSIDRKSSASRRTPPAAKTEAPRSVTTQEHRFDPRPPRAARDTRGSVHHRPLPIRVTQLTNAHPHPQAVH